MVTVVGENKHNIYQQRRVPKRHSRHIDFSIVPVSRSRTVLTIFTKVLQNSVQLQNVKIRFLKSLILQVLDRVSEQAQMISTNDSETPVQRF